VRCELRFPEREATKYLRAFFRVNWVINVPHQPDFGTFDLRAAARQTMIAQGFEPDFPPETEPEIA